MTEEFSELRDPTNTVVHDPSSVTEVECEDTPFSEYFHSMNDTKLVCLVAEKSSNELITGDDLQSCSRHKDGSPNLDRLERLDWQLTTRSLSRVDEVVDLVERRELTDVTALIDVINTTHPFEFFVMRENVSHHFERLFVFGFDLHG